MSEKLIAEGIQTILQGMADFSAGDVGICEWTILDGSTLNAPFVIIKVSDDLVSAQDTKPEDTTWHIPIHLYVRFVDWKESELEFRDTRQNILDEFNSQGSTNRSAGITATFVDVRLIRNAGEIDEWYRKYETDEETLASDPVFLHQELIFETRDMAN